MKGRALCVTAEGREAGLSPMKGTTLCRKGDRTVLNEGKITLSQKRLGRQDCP